MSFATAWEIAAGVRAGTLRPERIVAETLERIKVLPQLNAFTQVVAERAMQRARSPLFGPLAGVPFAAKNLFDIAGLPTRAGSAINRTSPAAVRDAALIRRLEAAGAILIGALNMGEYAYDFTGDNIHDGPSRNPHDITRMTGGSSGGSASAVAGGLVPLALASDTNGSIRIPASLCGLFGLKPTYGRLTRTGTFPLAASFDHLGPLARSVLDLALSYDAMQGPSEGDPACAGRVDAVTASLDNGIKGLRIAVAGRYFQEGAEPNVLNALQAVAQMLGVKKEIDLPGAARARAAAFLITAAEGAALHLERLRNQPNDFDPEVRDRLIAGALVPAAVLAQAQKFRRMFREDVLTLFQEVDVILAPASPCTAPLLDQKDFVFADQVLAVRPHLGVFTQPISFIGLPAIVVPVSRIGLPIGLQLIAAPWREDLVLRVARFLERAEVCLPPTPVVR